MSTLETRLRDLVTAVATDVKLFRTWITGTSTGDLSTLTTTTKASIIAAINEVKADEANFQPKNTNLTALAGFTTDADVNLAANSDTRLATQKAVKAYADSLLDANNAYVYKGSIDASTNPNYPAANAGWTYKIAAAGKIGGAAGVNVESGDTITSIVDGSVAGNQATVGQNWIIVQTNIDGAVVGPSASTADNITTFSGTTGKVVKDSGVAISSLITTTQIGNPDTDFAAVYTTAKA